MPKIIQPEYMLIREGPHTYEDTDSHYTLKKVNIIGRGLGNTICLLSVYVSRIQCKIIHDPDSNKWKIKDCGSLNGTFINNTKLIPNIYYDLNIDDRVCMGIEWTAYLQTAFMQNDEQYFVLRFAKAYPFNELAIDALSQEIAQM